MGRSTGWLDGEVRVEVSGQRLEQFINLVVTGGIDLWSLRRGDDGLVFWMRAEDFNRLRPIVRKTRCRVRIAARQGVPFYWRQFSRRQSMVIGVIMCFALVVLAASFVWVVEVEGLEERDPDVVLDAAMELGLAPGVPIYRLDLNQSARELAKELPFITWVGIERSGVRLTIKVLEKVEERPDPPALVDIVARTEGVVEEIRVLAGSPVVSAGDVVSKGSVLISSTPATPDRAATSARGQVFASVWYNAVERVALSQEVSLPTGREFVCTEVTVEDRATVRLQGWGEIPFDNYEAVEESRILFDRWRKPPFLVEVNRVYYKELSTYVRQLTEEEALQVACSGANHHVRLQIPPDAEVLRVSCAIVRQGEGFVEVEATVVVREDIGDERPVSER